MNDILTKKEFDESIENILNGTNTFEDYKSAYSALLLQIGRCSYTSANYCNHKKYEKLGNNKELPYNTCDLAKVFTVSIQRGEPLDKELFSKLILNIHHYNYYKEKPEHMECYKYNGENINALYDAIYDMGDTDIIQNLILSLQISYHYPYFNNKFLDSYVDNLPQINVSNITLLCQSRFQKICELDDKEVDPCPINIATKLIDRCKLDLDLETLFLIKSRNLHTVIANKLDKYDNTGSQDSGTDFKFTDTGFKAALLSMPYSQPLLPVYMSRGIEISIDHLKIALSHGNIDAIKFISKHIDFVADTALFDILINSVKYIGNYSKYVSWGYKSANPIDKLGYTINKGSGYSNVVFEILVDNGYILNIEDLKKSIRLRIELPNIERFNLELGNEIDGLCFLKKWYPRYTFKNIDPKLIDLQRLCIDPKISELKRFFKGSPNVKPNQYCMILVLMSKPTIKIVDLLIEKGGILDIVNLQWYSGFITKKGQSLFKAAINYHDKKELENETKINELENEIKLLKMTEITFSNKDTKIMKRKKMEISDEIKDTFKITDEKTSFCDLKKIVLSWIKKNDLTMNEQDKIRILLPKDVTDMIGLEDGYLYMENIDDLIRHLLLF